MDTSALEAKARAPEPTEAAPFLTPVAIDFQSFAETPEREIVWLWEGVIPHGMLIHDRRQAGPGQVLPRLRPRCPRVNGTTNARWRRHCAHSTCVRGGGLELDPLLDKRRDGDVQNTEMDRIKQLEERTRANKIERATLRRRLSALRRARDKAEETIQPLKSENDQLRREMDQVLKTDSRQKPLIYH